MADHIRVLAQRDDLFFASLACQMCGAEAVAIVTVQLDESDTALIDAGDLPPAVTAGDLEPRPDGRGAVEGDDVLAMHDFLRDFDGDFARLFDRYPAGGNGAAGA